jgi:hypothetical protein
MKLEHLNAGRGGQSRLKSSLGQVLLFVLRDKRIWIRLKAKE